MVFPAKVSSVFSALVLWVGLASCVPQQLAAVPAEPVEVNVVAINDLHGYLQPNAWTFKGSDGVLHTNMPAGGIATLGGILGQLRAQDPQLLFIGAGDMVGGSPPLSALWADEPTLEALRGMRMTLSALGNHELDAGKVEFLRQLNGGCESPRPDKACRFRPNYPGSGFPYIAANVIDTTTGKPLLPAYRIEEVHGVKVAFVGAVLRDVATVVSAKGMQGLRAIDEADSINRVIPELNAQGVNAIVAVIHQGGSTPEPYDQQDCQQLSGDIVDVARRLDPAVDVLVTGHSHRGYLCRVGNLLVTQGASYGHLLTRVTMQVTPGTHHVTEVKALNILVDPKLYPQDPKMAALQLEVETRSDQILLQPVGRIAASSINAVPDFAGESPLGDLIADAQLAMTEKLGAQIAFMNPGGIRADFTLEPGQTQLTYAQVASVQPFNNNLILVDLSGEQLLALLNQQWHNDDFKPLQISRGFTYRWDSRQPLGSRVLPQSLRLNGKPVQMDRSYRVVANAFLAEGGDHFTILKEGTQREDSGVSDLNALIDYLKLESQGGRAAGVALSAGRIVRVQ